MCKHVLRSPVSARPVQGRGRLGTGSPGCVGLGGTGRPSHSSHSTAVASPPPCCHCNVTQQRVSRTSGRRGPPGLRIQVAQEEIKDTCVMGRNPSGDLGGAHETSLANDTKTPGLKRKLFEAPPPSQAILALVRRHSSPVTGLGGCPSPQSPPVLRAHPKNWQWPPSPDRTALALRMWLGP